MGRGRFVTVAADADLERAGLFADRVRLTTLVDRDNALARILGYRAIPNGFAFSVGGELIGSKITGFDVRDAATRELTLSWLDARGAPSLPAPGAEAASDALELFAEGSQVMRAGRSGEALELWARAYERDRGNLVIRKQIWRALYPERFGDPIDLAWQKEQIAREDALGFRTANPGLPAARSDPA